MRPVTSGNPVTDPGHSNDINTYLPAAGVVPAARARVARARALHHAAALLAGRAEVAPLHLRRDHRRGVGEGGGRRLRPRWRPVGSVGAVAVPLAGGAVAPARGGVRQ